MRFGWNLLRLIYLLVIISCFFLLIINANSLPKGAESAIESDRHATETTTSTKSRIKQENVAPDAQTNLLSNRKKVKKNILTNNAYNDDIHNEAAGRVASRPNEAAATKLCDSKSTADASVKDTSVFRDTDEVGVSQLHKLSEIIDKSAYHKVKHKSEVPNIANEYKVISVAEVLNEAVAQQQQSESPLNIAVTQSDVESLPEIITEIPTVTVTELPLEILEPTHSVTEAVLIDGSKDVTQERDNSTVDVFENSNEEMQKDEQIVKINDPGGGGSETIEVLSSNEENIPNLENATISIKRDDAVATNVGMESATYLSTDDGGSSITNSTEKTPTVNLTVEEVPIPVFSEWAQKQMEAEASKQQAMEQEQQQQTVNSPAHKKNFTNGNGKPLLQKKHGKNYASPDCGAKIIASNQDATNTGAVLSSPKDEYMLSPCGNRIWFVVELCEAIQAQKIDLANFELFSSSPKNFTVAVSNRFPTRDWSNVGRFIAEDKRDVQSFDLHPHLFGKFVRVDIHSHYSKEHFCPVSLFRVFGTSEFEAFETENQPNDDLDDFDDEFSPEQQAKSSENIFKSASDAVIQMVKKAAEVVLKPTSHALKRRTEAAVCHTPIFGKYTCDDCNSTLVERVNNALSCEYQQLHSLLHVSRLREHLLHTSICSNDFGIELTTAALPAMAMHKKQSYFISLLPAEYTGALCKLLAECPSHLQLQYYPNSTIANKSDNADATLLNITPPAAHETKAKDTTAESSSKQSAAEKRAIDSALGSSTECIESITDSATIKATTSNDNIAVVAVELEDAGAAATTETTSTTDSEEQLTRPPVDDATHESVTATNPSLVATAGDLQMEVTTVSPGPTPAPDVNIFNVPDVEATPEPVASDKTLDKHESTPAVTETVVVVSPATTAEEDQSDVPNSATEASAGAAVTPVDIINPPRSSDEDPSNWESIDNLLTSTVASISVSGATAASAGNALPTSGLNLQHKLSNGAQSESVFIRLSNRIKTLERNMSLSGQYLEELSRRYKKQVEDLQQTLTQQAQTVRTLEEQSRRHIELEQYYAHLNSRLNEEVNSLTLQIQACIVVVIFVGAIVLLVVVIGTVYYRGIRRETQELLLLHAAGKRKPNLAVNHLNMHRRKSFEDFSDHHHNSANEKQRRPSEEAMLILKDCGDVTLQPTESSTSTSSTPLVGDTAAPLSKLHLQAGKRQRKISICYGSAHNVSSSGGNSGAVNSVPSVLKKRKGEKHSWPNTEETQRQARMHMAVLDNEAHDNFNDRVTLAPQPKPKLNGSHEQNSKIGKSKKKQLQQQLKRQESAPSTFSSIYGSAEAAGISGEARLCHSGTQSDFDESLLLDDEDISNFLPTSDLAYNEFMPEGPSGYQVIVDVPVAQKKTEKVSNGKKTRRLSSPAFFKSPFSKSLKIKSLSSSKSTNPAHEPTSWEWYRLRKSEAAQLQHKNHQQLQLQQQREKPMIVASSPTASLDSSSLSEINFPTNSTRNSFRILEEAIMSAGEADTTATTNAASKS